MHMHQTYIQNWIKWRERESTWDLASGGWLGNTLWLWNQQFSKWLLDSLILQWYVPGEAEEHNTGDRDWDSGFLGRPALPHFSGVRSWKSSIKPTPPAIPEIFCKHIILYVISLSASGFYFLKLEPEWYNRTEDSKLHPVDLNWPTTWFFHFLCPRSWESFSHF